jgi:hypothetical protein
VSTEQARGGLRKMITSLGGDSVTYALPVGAQQLPLNPLLGQTLELRYAGEIRCIHCGRSTKQELQPGLLLSLLQAPGAAATAASSAPKSAITTPAPAANRSGARRTA